MKAVVQVVDDATLKVDEKIISQIGRGLVVFFCVEKGDDDEKLQFFCKKIPSLRVFPDENDKTNLSVQDVKGEILLVSQFTLAGDVQHSNRPNFDGAEKPERAKETYLKLAEMLKMQNIPVKLGVFGAEMKISQTNAGPFTILLNR